MSVPTDDITGEPVAANHERKQRHPLLVWAWSLVHLDFVGVAFGALFFCLSLTPSLLPRDWLFQGLIGGLNAAIGYGIGVFAGKMVRRFVLRRRIWWPPSKRVLYWLKAATVALSATASVLMLIPAAAWQRRVSAVMGMEGPGTAGPLHPTSEEMERGWRVAGRSLYIPVGDNVSSIPFEIFDEWYISPVTPRRENTNLSSSMTGSPWDRRRPSIPATERL